MLHSNLETGEPQIYKLPCFVLYSILPKVTMGNKNKKKNPQTLQRKIMQPVLVKWPIRLLLASL